MATKLGTQLKEAREQAGMSVKDVSELTKIRDVYIRDLEEERLDNLPSRVYVIGFLRNLGRAYKMDSEGLVQAYRELVDEKEILARQEQTEKTAGEEAYIRETSSRVAEPARGSQEKTVAPVPRKPKREASEREEEVLQSLGRRSVVRRQLKGLAAVLLLVGFIVLFVYGLRYFNDGSGAAPPEDPGVTDGLPEDPVDPLEPSEPLLPEPDPEPEPDPGVFEPREVRYSSPAPVPGGLDIMVRVRDEDDALSWLRAEVDGSRVFEGTLQAGEVIRLYAADVVNVRIGDAGAVELYRDGILLPFDGQPGAVVDQVFLVE